MNNNKRSNLYQEDGERTYTCADVTNNKVEEIPATGAQNCN